MRQGRREGKGSALVAAGETGGILDTILERLAVFHEMNDAPVRKIKGVISYPAVMMFVAIAATPILIWKVVPVVAGIFEDAGMALPAPTLIALTISVFLRGYIHLVASGASILEGLEITARTAGNRVVHDAVMSSRASVAGGATISDPLTVPADVRPDPDGAGVRRALAAKSG